MNLTKFPPGLNFETDVRSRVKKKNRKEKEKKKPLGCSQNGYSHKDNSTVIYSVRKRFRNDYDLENDFFNLKISNRINFINLMGFHFGRGGGVFADERYVVK